MLKKKAVNVTLAPIVRDKLEAIAEYKVGLGDQRPDRTWMLEQGANLFIRESLAKYPDLKPLFEDIETRYERAAGVVRFATGAARQKLRPERGR